MITERMNFIKGLNLCVQLFLIKKSIIPKKQGNHFMKGDDLASHIVECLKFCKDSIIRKVPESQNKKYYYMKDEIRLMILCDALKDYHTEKMNVLTEVARAPNNFEKSHQSIKEEVDKLFAEISKCIETQENFKYERILKDEINNAYKDFKHLNENVYNLEETQNKISMNYEDKDIIEKKLREVDLTQEERKSLEEDKEKIEKEIEKLDTILRRKSEEQERLFYEQRCVISLKLTSNFLYKMSSKPLGKGLILNIFEEKEPWIEQDSLRWNSAFTALNFKTQRKDRYFDKRSLFDFFHEFKKSLEGHDGVIISISSHGDTDELILRDGRIKIGEIIDNFSNKNCNSLRGKPKIFFINACRGVNDSMETYAFPNVNPNQISNRVTIEPSSSYATPFENREAISNASVQGPKEFDLKILPEFSDIIICYSTMKGYLSWYDMNDGTIFSKQACYILEKYSKDLDLETVLKMITTKVIQLSHRKWMQTVSVEQIGWLKYLYFDKK